MTDLNIYSKEQIDTKLSEKQDTLSSGINIKTINGNSIVGSGDIAVGSNISIIDHTNYFTITY